MRGNPFIRVMVAIAVFLLLGIPVWKLTRIEASQVKAVATSQSDKEHLTTLSISFEYESVPSEILFRQSVGARNDEMSVRPPPGKPPQASWTIDCVNKNADIVVSTSWPDKGRHALRLIFSGADMQPQEKTLWLDAEQSSDVISLQFSR